MELNANPLVIVVMSVYRNDKARFLQQAIDSIVCQTYDNLLLYIAVDGPIDDAVRLLLDGCQSNQKIKIFFYEENLGLAARLNCLIDKALEKDAVFIARMDADDISFPERITQQVDHMMRNPALGVLGASLIEIDAAGNQLFEKIMPGEHEVLSKNIIKRCPFNHPTVIFRSEIFREKGFRYNSKLLNTQDYYLWVDLLQAGVKFSNIESPLLYFRVDDLFYTRRGLAKAVNDFKARLHAMNKLKCKTFRNYFLAVALFSLRVSPSWVKKVAYRRFR